VVEEKLGRLGGTPYHLGKVQLTTDGNAFVPTSLLNQARRELVDSMFEASGQVESIAAESVWDAQLTQYWLLQRTRRSLRSRWIIWSCTV